MDLKFWKKALREAELDAATTRMTLDAGRATDAELSIKLLLRRVRLVRPTCA